MLVSVLIPTLNEVGAVEEMASRVAEQRLEGEAEAEFLFIDGGSDDGTREILDRLAAGDARFRVLDNPRRGIPFALNIGLRSARGEFVARMDAHTLYPADYLALGIERLRRGDGVVWASGPQLAHGVDRWSRRVALALQTRLGIGGATFRTLGHEIETDAGYTGVWRRQTLLDRGGWDEGWEVNEDGELAARIIEAGGTIVCMPEMAALYTPRSSLSALARQYWRYGMFRAKTCRAHPRSMRRSHALPPGLAMTTVTALAPSRPARALARAGLAAYAVALATSAVRRAASAEWRDAAWLPVVLATMHLAWGFGFIAGCLRFGPPWRALAGLVPRRR